MAAAGLSDDPLTIMMQERAVTRSISRHGGKSARRQRHARRLYVREARWSRVFPRSRMECGIQGVRSAPVQKAAPARWRSRACPMLFHDILCHVASLVLLFSAAHPAAFPPPLRCSARRRRRHDPWVSDIYRCHERSRRRPQLAWGLGSGRGIGERRRAWRGGAGPPV